MGAVRENQPHCQRRKRHLSHDAGKPRRLCYGPGMTPRKAAPLLLAPILLSACASSPSDRYPSLAMRDFERVGGTGTPVEPATPPPPPPPVLPDEALSARLERLRAQAEEAHRAFLAATPRARSAVSSAAGAPRASDRWVEAEMAVSSLESTRGRAMVALADLDSLKVSATLEDGAVEAINAVHATVGELVAQEDRIIDELVRRFPG